jgi:hypothetical protein
MRQPTGKSDNVGPKYRWYGGKPTRSGLVTEGELTLKPDHKQGPAGHLEGLDRTGTAPLGLLP